MHGDWNTIHRYLEKIKQFSYLLMTHSFVTRTYFNNDYCENLSLPRHRYEANSTEVIVIRILCSHSIEI